MKIEKKLKKQILGFVMQAGSLGTTLIEISEKVGIERHTLAKYLYILQGEGLLVYREIGKVKLWFINKDPLAAILNSPVEPMSLVERILFEVIDSSPTCKILTDVDFNVKYANKKAKKQYPGIPGKNFLEVLGIKKLGSFIGNLIEVKDMHGNILELTASIIENPDESKSYVLVFSDVTKRVEAENELKLRLEQQEALSQLGIKTMSMFNFEAISEEVLKIVSKFMNTKHCDILKLNQENKALVLIKSMHGSKMEGEVIISADPVYQAGFSLLNKEPVIVNDFENDRFTLTPYQAKYNLKSGITVPILGPKQAFGILAVYFDKKRKLENSDVFFLQAVANLLAQDIMKINWIKELDAMRLQRIKELKSGSKK